MTSQEEITKKVQGLLKIEENVMFPGDKDTFIELFKSARGGCEHKNVGDNVLIVMIGNMPTDPSVVPHWERFIREADDTLHIVIHPYKRDMAQGIADRWQGVFNNPSRFMVSDVDHWVKTKWGNISLSYATLMAMEYAMKGKPFNYYKKIVFIQQGSPLYRYEILKQQFLKDDKSWFKPRDGHYPGWQYSKPYNFNREGDDGATIHDWNWWNAIFALDSSHFSVMFDETRVENGLYTGTYKKQGTYDCYGEAFENIVPINKGKYDVLFEQVTGSWEWNNTSRTASCINSDEVFFGLAFKQNFPGNEVSTHTRTINLDAVERLFDKNVLKGYQGELPYRMIYLFDGEEKRQVDIDKFGFMDNFPDIPIKNRITSLDEEIYVYLPRIVWLNWELYKGNTDYPLYTGVATNYNPERLKEYYVMRTKYLEENKVSILENGVDVLRPYDPNNRKKTRAHYGENYPSWDNDGLKYKIKNTNHSDPQQYNLKENYDQALTYHDWTSFTYSPDNLFRDAMIAVKKNNKCSILTKAIDLISLPPKDLVSLIEKDDYHFVSGKLPIWHPTEYYSDTLKSIINAYNIISLCPLCSNNTLDRGAQIKIHVGGDHGYNINYGNNFINENFNYGSNYGNYSHGQTHNFFNLIKIVRFIWRRAIMMFGDFVVEKFSDQGKSYFLIRDDLPQSERTKLEKVRVGTCVTGEVLSSALATGTMFIRKCTKQSEFDKYSDAVFKIPKYVPDEIEKFSTYSKKDKVGEFLTLPESVFTWESFRMPRDALCSKLRFADLSTLDLTKVKYDKANDSVTIGNNEYAFVKVFARGTNVVKLYMDGDGVHILVKEGDTPDKIKGDLKAIELIAGKPYEKYFIKTVQLDDKHILLEGMDSTVTSLAADYIYNSFLSIKEIVKMIYFLIDGLRLLKEDGLYYDDLKNYNILYRCENEKYTVKYGDLGAVSTEPNSLSFMPPEGFIGDRRVTWGLAILMAQIYSGEYISSENYKKALESGELTKFLDKIKESTKYNLNRYYNEPDITDRLIEITNSLLDVSNVDNYPIERLHQEVKDLYNKVIGHTGGYNGASSWKTKYLKYKKKYIDLRSKINLGRRQ